MAVFALLPTTRFLPDGIMLFPVQILTSFCYFIQIVARQMIAQGLPGAIVNVSSQASQRALRDHAVYCKYPFHF